MRLLAAVLGRVALGLLALTGAGAQSLGDLAGQVGAKLYWEPYRQTVLVADARHRLSVDLASGLVVADGEAAAPLLSLDPATGALSAAEFRRLADWWQGASDPVVVVPPRRPDPAGSGARVQVIVLDAGHGGSDPGSIARHEIDGKTVVLQEKDLTLQVVLELRRLLAEAYPDRSIVLTRNADTYPSLERRVQIAHTQKLADNESIVFLSVHFNASLNKKARGLEFWYVPDDYDREVIAGSGIPDSVFPVLNSLVDSEYKKESRDLAVHLAKSLGKVLGDSNPQRGLKENPWFVVRMARMPAVLAELGFLTNPDEALSLQDPEYLKRLAQGLYTGLQSFVSDYEDHS